MSIWPAAAAGFFAYVAARSFLRIVGQEVQIQRLHLEALQDRQRDPPPEDPSAVVATAAPVDLGGLPEEPPTTPI